MTRYILIVIELTLLLALHSLSLGADKKSEVSMSFAVANIYFEQNATDGDVEVVFEAQGGDAGLVKLTVVSPDGRTVADFRAPDSSTLGFRQVRYESPERGDVDSIKTAYPEGTYTFDAVSTAGDQFHGTATLSHNLPATASFLQPEADAEDIDVKGLKITWTPIKNLAFYILEIIQEDLDVSITAKLPDTMTTFTVPDGFLRPGKEYELSLGTVTDKGNISFIETSFTTTEKAKSR